MGGSKRAKSQQGGSKLEMHLEEADNTGFCDVFDDGMVAIGTCCYIEPLPSFD